VTRDDTLDGATPSTVRAALADAEPLPGTAGFAGLCDGTLVRDVLGRRPVFVDDATPERWGFTPDELVEPRLLPAGCRLPLGEPVAAADRVWSLPDPGPRPVDEAVAAVETAVRDHALVGTGGQRGTADSERPAAVAFSGGVDSAVVAAGRPDAPLYVAGFPGAHDVAAAREAAAAMDRELRWVEIDHNDLRRAVPAVAAATGRTNPMDLSIAVPLFLVAERVVADGFDRLVVGQGADELFGGYAKVADPANDDRVDATTVRGARRETVLSLPRQLPRDVLTLRAAGVEPVAPFLHDDVIRAALRLPEEALVADDRRKVALRRAADGVVPETARRADKKAVQYGTYVSRELDRLARQAGFKRRMDDHVGRYIRALVDGDLERA
jgi:asparagine synthase (glutamine-hydrolysing)